MYVAGESASLNYRIIHEISPAEYQQLLRRGWRRFSEQFFRPACPACTKCRSLRVPVDRFRPSRSQRRTLDRNARLRVIVQKPTVTREHVTLYNKYHADMNRRRNWPEQTETAETYQRAFLDGGGGCAREFLFYDGDKLIGVGLADILPDALSSVYFFHAPEYRRNAPGVLSVLKQLGFASEHGLRHQYPGYWIAECGSMAYKSQYRPHEILQYYPADDEEPLWMEAEKV